jgi:hypothetical protein
MLSAELRAAASKLQKEQQQWTEKEKQRLEKERILKERARQRESKREEEARQRRLAELAAAEAVRARRLQLSLVVPAPLRGPLHDLMHCAWRFCRRKSGVLQTWSTTVGSP